MKPASFQHHRPQSVTEACDLLATLPQARILAGGQSLVPMLGMRYVSFEHLIDIHDLAELKAIEETAEGVRIGAAVIQNALLASPLVASRLPLLVQALRHVGHLQTRNRGTFVGSLCHFDAASEQPLMACLHDARVEVRSRSGTRHLEFDHFGLGYMTNALEPDELVVGVTLKPWPASAGCAFEEFARRRGDFAIAGCGVLMQLASDRRIERLAIGLCGVGSTPVRLRAAEEAAIGSLSDEPILAAVRQELDILSLVDDANATAAYRRRLAQTLAARALTRAFDDCLQRRSIA